MQEKCIIVPCYNESGRIPLELFDVHYNESNIHYCFVNDGSTDSTLARLVEFSIGKDRVLVVDCKINQGKSAAVREGMLKAMTWQQFEILGFVDADLATPLYEIDRLLACFTQNIQVVFGSRIRTLNTKITRKSYRHYLGRIISTLIDIFILKLHIYDTQCGIKLIRYPLAKQIFREKFSTGWLFDVELFMRIVDELKGRVRLEVLEVPLNEWNDKSGSKISFFNGLGIIRDFCWLLINRKKQ